MKSLKKRERERTNTHFTHTQQQIKNNVKSKKTKRRTLLIMMTHIITPKIIDTIAIITSKI